MEHFTWNKLHSDIKLAPSIQLFKAKLKIIIENIPGKLVLIFRFSFQVFINRCFIYGNILAVNAISLLAISFWNNFSLGFVRILFGK